MDLYANVSPSRDHWLNAGSGVSGIYYSMIFNRDEVRVNFALGTRSKEANKASMITLGASRYRGFGWMSRRIQAAGAVLELV